MTKRIAIFSGRFNPPSIGHQEQLNTISTYFDQIIVVPSGKRPDKPLTNDIPSYYRAALIDLAFNHIPKVQVDLFDMENGTFTRTKQLEDRYQHLGQLWHIVSSSMINGGHDGSSVIQTSWEYGTELWKTLNFAILYDPNSPPNSADLPPHHQLIAAPTTVTSADLRAALYNKSSLQQQIAEPVLAYISRYHLYSGLIPRSRCYRKISCRHPLVVVDSKNPRALTIAEELTKKAATNAPYDFIVAVGGDGTMLHAIRDHWRKRLPFYGINTGHLGFLLNDATLELNTHQELLFEHLPLLHVEVTNEAGQQTALAFNDAWVERASGQTAHIEITVDGQVRLPRLIADGALVSTAAGSTSYARAMGAMPIPMESQAQLLVGSNVQAPTFFKPVVLPFSSQILMKPLEIERRPLNGFIDGISYGAITSLATRMSRVASIELLFDPEYDATEKLARIQFPH